MNQLRSVISESNQVNAQIGLLVREIMTDSATGSVSTEQQDEEGSQPKLFFGGLRRTSSSFSAEDSPSVRSKVNVMRNQSEPSLTVNAPSIFSIASPSRKQSSSYDSAEWQKIRIDSSTNEPEQMGGSSEKRALRITSSSKNQPSSSKLGLFHFNR